MPLEVITANRGKDYSIFEIFAPFVEKLVGAYKQSQQSKWDNEWMSSAIADIENANDKSVIDAYILKKDPPDDYMDIEGVTQFANDSMNLLTKKEIATGGLTPTVAPQVGEQVGEQQLEQPQFMPDVKEFNELYKFVSELPTGQVDWSNTLNMFKKKLESGRAMGSAAQQFLNMILGQQPTDQRAKFEQDFDLASRMKETLYPGEEKPSSYYEWWRQEPEKYEEFARIGKDPEKKLDIDALNTFMVDNGLKVKSVTVNEKGERTIYLEPIETGREEPNLSDMLILIKKLEEEGFDASYTKDGLRVSVPNEPKPEKGITPTYGVYGNMEEDLENNVESIDDFTRELQKLKSLNYDTKAFETTEYFAELMKKKYEKAMEYIRYSFSKISAGIYQDEEGNHREIHREYWEKARQYDQEYFNVTGKKLLTAGE